MSETESSCCTQKPESFTKDLVKTFALSTASMAGALGGMVVIGTVLNVAQKRSKTKTAQTETPTTEV